MNKILRYSFVALLAMIGLNISAQEVTIDFSGSEDVWGIGTTKLVATQSFTHNGITIKLTGTEGNGYRWYDSGNIILGKQGATLEFPAFNFDVARIDIEGTSGASAAVKQNIFVGEEAVSTETTGAKSVTNQYNIAEGKQAAGTIYTLKVTSAHNTQITKIMIYKKGSSAKDQAGISWSKASQTVTIGADDNIFPTLNNPNNLTVSYTSSKEEVATINANGEITLVGAGTTQISAIFEGNDTYEASTVSYSLTVKEAIDPNAKGQVNNPYTVAEALEVINALENGATTADKFYVKGFVVGTPDIQKKEDGTFYGNANFTIADTKGGTDLLTCYRLKGIDNANIESEDYIKEDDELVVMGQLQKYVKNEVVTPEVKSGHIVSIKSEVVIPTPEVEGTKIAEFDYTTAEAYPFFRLDPPATASYDVTGGALVINNTVALEEWWNLQPFVLDWFNVKEGANYNIAIYMEATDEVTYNINFGTWGSSMPLYGIKAPAARGWSVCTIENATFATSGNDAHILFQCGAFVGTIKIYKVELYEVEGTGINNVNAAKAENAVRYNLAGQKVSNDYKGVVIENGKKVVVK